MRAITLHQPYASLIAEGLKTIETRSWPPPLAYIGRPLAIHAGKAQAQMEALDDAELDILEQHFGSWWWGRLPYGAVIATCTLARVVQFPHKDAPPDAFGSFTPGRYGWILTDIEKVGPHPARGQQGFWEWIQPL